MTPGTEPPPLREQFAGLVDAGKAYARAELVYYKTLATVRGKAIGIGVGFAVGALLILQAALTVLLAALGLLVARWIGPAGGFAVAAVIGLAVAAVLARVGLKRITSAGGAS